jgi:hypothetical protein
MKLKEFVENMNEFIKENPDALELDVITSKDDEGNGYSMVTYTISKGYLDQDDYLEQNNLQEFGFDNSDINAVCLN